MNFSTFFERFMAAMISRVRSEDALNWIYTLGNLNQRIQLMRKGKTKNMSAIDYPTKYMEVSLSI